jgi:hypothetical protein
MKKIYASLGIVLAATLSLTNCTKQLESPVEIESEGIPFEVSALLTKTTNDGMSTKWASSDAINVFHAEAGTTTYVSDGQFKISDATNGTFSGTLASALDESKTYDWYAIYPYSQYLTTPAAKSGGYVYVGAASNKTQTQSGNNSTAHLCGSACPLYGVAKGVSASDSPSFAMKNLTSVICVNVTNTTNDDLTVTSVSFTSAEDIVGQYYIDFTGTNPVYTGSQYVGKTATLTVNNGTALKKGESAKFYIAIKPHTVASGSTLKLSVNGVEKSITLTSDATFKAGSIKTLTFSFDKNQYVTLPWSIDGSDGAAAWSSTPGLSQSGVTSDYDSSNSPYLAKMNKDGNYVQVRYDSSAKCVSFGVKMIGGATTSTMTLSGSPDGTLFTNIEAFEISGSQYDIKTFTSSKAISADYRYIRLTFTKGSNVGLGPVAIYKDSSDPQIVVDNVFGISARGASDQTFTYTVLNPVAGTSPTVVCDGTIVTGATESEGTVTYSVSKNTTKAAREGKITLTYGTTVKEVKVSQLADTFSTTVTEIELDAEASATKKFTITSDFDWVASMSGSGFSCTPSTYTWSNGGKQEVTVTAMNANASESGTVSLGTIVITNSETGAELKVLVKQKSSYVAPVTGTSVTFDYKALYGTSVTSGSKDLDGTSDTVDNVTIAYAKISGNAPSYYKNGTNLRIYNKNTLTITVPTGKTIKTVDFSQGTTTWASGKMAASHGTVSDSDKKWNYDSTKTSNSLVLTVTGSFKFTKIVVIYE